MPSTQEPLPSRPSFSPRKFAGHALALAILVAPGVAAAVDVGVTLSWVSELSGRKQSGPGAELRVGGTGRAGEVFLTSELGAIFLAPGNARVYGAIAGWRLRFGDVVQPGALLHLGLAHHTGGGLVSFTDGLWDVGGLLDFAVVPKVTLGIHLEYSGFFAGSRAINPVVCAAADPACGAQAAENPNWLAYGIHGSARF